MSPDYSGTPLAKKLSLKDGMRVWLMDIKVCAVDEIWSGLKLVIGKESR